MQLERRALYNLLRQNYILDTANGIKPKNIEPWQVENYRQLSGDELFQQLTNLGFPLNKAQFIAYSDTFDTPEEFADDLVAEITDAKVQDQIYLLVFELWRRFIPQKRSLSLFCDELDEQILQYDITDGSNEETLQDTLSELKGILDDNVDQGLPAVEAFLTIGSYSANDLETFLYDFISEQIDLENFSFAKDLLEDFHPYFKNHLWFSFLEAKLSSFRRPDVANQSIHSLLKELEAEPDAELYFEILDFLVKGGDEELFHLSAEALLPELDCQDDLVDFLDLAIEFTHRLDWEKNEAILKDLKAKFNANPPTFPLSQNIVTSILNALKQC